MRDFENKKNMVVGMRQTLRAAKEGRLRSVTLAKDTDSALFAKVYSAMLSLSVPVDFADTMAELGTAVHIDVGCAVVGFLKEDS